MADVRWQGFREVSPGDHIVFIYEGTSELRAFVVPFIKEGLARGERCLYVVDDQELPEVTEALAAAGVDVDRESRRGALVFMNARSMPGRRRSIRCGWWSSSGGGRQGPPPAGSPGSGLR